MGELLLCHETMAAVPYYMDEIGINLYTMEELCYYIYTNACLIDRSFMNEELCTWIGQEAQHPQLAEKLQKMIKSDRKLSDFVFAILKDTAYGTMKEMQDSIFAIRQMEEKSDFERSKIRADQLMRKEKYLAAIYEYKRLLAGRDVQEADALLRGAIWHNLGVAYARLFLFAEAGRCFETAYGWNEKEESLKECLMCFRCLHDEEKFAELKETYHLDDMAVLELKNELSIATKDEELEAFEAHLEELAQQKQGAQKNEAKDEIRSIINNWKKEYRRSCKV